MNTRDTARLLKNLIRIPSMSGGEELIARTLLQWCQKRGLSVETFGKNLVIRIGDNPQKRLLLNSHIDTVAPVPSWVTDPFTPKEEGDRIIGLGANDAKGCVVSMLGAVVNLSKQKIDGEVVLALTAEEESGNAKEGLGGLTGKLGEFHASVIGEPTNLTICHAQKGLIVLEVETTGVARHAAHAHRVPGNNAAKEAARAILALENWHPGPNHDILGQMTCEVTTIHGGTRRNVIPDRCTFTLDLRTTPMLSTEEIVRQIKDRTKSKVRVLDDRMKPLQTDKSSDIVIAAQQAAPGSQVVASSTMSDAVWTRHVPTIKVGPGKTERSHTAGEFVTKDELRKGVSFYEKLILNYFAKRETP